MATWLNIKVDPMDKKALDELLKEKQLTNLDLSKTYTLEDFILKFFDKSEAGYFIDGLADEALTGSLTQKEIAELKKLFVKFNAGKDITQADADRFDELFEKADKDQRVDIGQVFNAAFRKERKQWPITVCQLNHNIKAKVKRSLKHNFTDTPEQKQRKSVFDPANNIFC